MQLHLQRVQRMIMPHFINLKKVLWKSKGILIAINLHSLF